MPRIELSIYQLASAQTTKPQILHKAAEAVFLLRLLTAIHYAAALFLRLRTSAYIHARIRTLYFNRRSEAPFGIKIYTQETSKGPPRVG